jgi:hypothetical protein
VRALDENSVPPRGTRDVEQLVRAGKVGAIVVAASAEPQWRSVLAPFGRPQAVGGVDLYLRHC